MAARCFELSILWDFRAGCRVVMMCSRYHEVFAFELAEQKMSKVIARSPTLELYVKYYQTSCFERDIGSAVFLARPTKTQSMLAPGGVLLPNCIYEKYHNTEQTCADIHIYLHVYIHTHTHTHTYSCTRTCNIGMYAEAYAQLLKQRFILIRFQVAMYYICAVDVLEPSQHLHVCMCVCVCKHALQPRIPSGPACCFDT
jgi:hypothetical protein